MRVCLALALLARATGGSLAAQSAAPVYDFTTLAGYAGSGSMDGTGSAAQFNGPRAVAVDAGGNIYVADQYNGTIRKVTPGGAVTTLAGTAGIYGSADGTGAAAQFNQPSGVAVDMAGNVYVADTGNDTIRKITPGGVVTTLAGTAGSPGAMDGAGGAAQFNQPLGIAADLGGNVYVADSANNEIRKITAGGVVSTLAGTPGARGSADGTGSAALFDAPEGVAVDANGVLYVADTSNGTIRKISADGSVTTIAGTAGMHGNSNGTGMAASFASPVGIAVDGTGNVFVADNSWTADTTGGTLGLGLPSAPDNSIRAITPGGVVTTLAGSPYSAQFNQPQGVAVNASGDVYVADTGSNTIREISPGPTVTVIAGISFYSASYGEYLDGTGAAARFGHPTGVAVDGSGTVYVADTNNEVIRKITPDGVVTTFAGTPGPEGSADGTGAAARFFMPKGVAVDAVGNVFVADTVNNMIRKITPAGAVTTVAGAPGAYPYAPGGSADGTGSAAQFNGPTGIAVDGSGNLYVADTGNGTVRKITADAVVTTLAGTVGVKGSVDGTGTAAQFGGPDGIAVDGAGNLYVADGLTIRKITPGGVVSTLAGSPVINDTQYAHWGVADGTGPAARFYDAVGIAVDGGGNLFVTDAGADGSGVIRKVSPAGVVTTIAGAAYYNGISLPWATADGTGAAAQFLLPLGVAVAANGTVYVADTLNNRIQLGRPTAGATTYPAFSGQPSSQTIAVGGTVVFSVSSATTPSPAYQWLLNGTDIAGATNPVLIIRGAASSNDGSYTCIATNPSGNVASNAAFLSVSSTTDFGRLVNLSCRAQVGAGPNILIAGFVVGGEGTAGLDTVLVRASGPAIAASPFDVPGALADPDILVNSLPSGAYVAANAGWGGNTVVASAAAAVGAFPWTDPSSKDSALLLSLSGASTVRIAGAAGDTGVALAELYDATPAGSLSASSPRLINLSARAGVGTGANVLIAGFVVAGSTSETVLIRASGPALAANPFNVAGTLADPALRLDLLNGDGTSTLLASNSGWGGEAQISEAAASVGAFSWGSSATADSAVLVTLPPGAYTAQVSGASGDSGVALVEIYEVR